MRTLLMGGKAQIYADRIKSVFGGSLLGLWPLNELSGTVAYDVSGNGRHGAYINTPTLGQSGIANTTSMLSSRSPSKYLDFFSASLAAVFNPNEFTILLAHKVTNAQWALSSYPTFLSIRSSDNDRTAFIQVPGGWYFYYVGDGTVFQQVPSATISLQAYFEGWMIFALTVSKTSNKMLGYVNGDLITTSDITVPVWTGAISTAKIGAAFDSNMSYLAIGNTALSAAQIKQMVCQLPPCTTQAPVFFGDSIGFGYGISVPANKWANLVCASKGWTNFYNSSIGSTSVQNTPQTGGTIIGGAAANNGYDTVMTRVLIYKPNWAFIEYGVNDYFNAKDTTHYPLYSLGNMASQYQTMVARIIANGTLANQVVLMTLPYLYNGDTGGNVYNAAIQNIATLYGTKFVDIKTAMANNGGDTLLQADHVHPNEAGEVVIANTVLAAI
jgi:lysophospholipase L1-like esterase